VAFIERSKLPKSCSLHRCIDKACDGTTILLDAKNISPHNQNHTGYFSHCSEVSVLENSGSAAVEAADS